MAFDSNDGAFVPFGGNRGAAIAQASDASSALHVCFLAFDILWLDEVRSPRCSLVLFYRVHAAFAFLAQLD